MNERQEEEEKRRMIYTVFLPLLEGSFRASLQGNAEDQLQLCLESGKFDPFWHCLLIRFRVLDGDGYQRDQSSRISLVGFVVSIHLFVGRI